MSEFSDRPYSDAHLDELESAAIYARTKYLSEDERTERINQLQVQIQGEMDPFKRSKLEEELEIVQNPE